MSSVNKVQFNSLTNFDASTLTGTYQSINGTGTSGPAKAFKFYNSSTSLVVLSFDGTTDHDFVPPGSAFVFDGQANNEGSGGKRGHYFLSKGQIVYAKTSSDTDRLIMAVYL